MWATSISSANLNLDGSQASLCNVLPLSGVATLSTLLLLTAGCNDGDDTGWLEIVVVAAVLLAALLCSD